MCNRSYPEPCCRERTTTPFFCDCVLMLPRAFLIWMLSSVRVYKITAQSSVLQTRNPTIRPSFRPSRGPGQPTWNPTPSNVVGINGSVVLTGTKAWSVTKNVTENLVMQESISQVLNGSTASDVIITAVNKYQWPSSSMKVEGMNFGAKESENPSEISDKTDHFHATSTLSMVAAKVSFTIILNAPQYSSAAVAFNILSAQLMGSVSSGQLTTVLRRNGYYEGTNSFLTASVHSIVALPMPLTSPPTVQPTAGTHAPTYLYENIVAVKGGLLSVGLVYLVVLVIPVVVIMVNRRLRRVILIEDLPPQCTVRDVCIDMVGSEYITQTRVRNAVFVEFKTHTDADRIMVEAEQHPFDIVRHEQSGDLSANITPALPSPKRDGAAVPNARSPNPRSDKAKVTKGPVKAYKGKGIKISHNRPIEMSSRMRSTMEGRKHMLITVGEKEDEAHHPVRLRWAMPMWAELWIGIAPKMKTRAKVEKELWEIEIAKKNSSKHANNKFLDSVDTRDNEFNHIMAEINQSMSVEMEMMEKSLQTLQLLPLQGSSTNPSTISALNHGPVPPPRVAFSPKVLALDVDDSTPPTSEKCLVAPWMAGLQIISRDPQVHPWDVDMILTEHPCTLDSKPPVHIRLW